MPLSSRMFCRAEAELLGGDFSFAIILGAMSVECELASLHSTWKMLDAGLIPIEVTQVHTNRWEKEFRELKDIRGKLNGMTKLLTGGTFDSFLARRSDLAAALQQAHSEIGVTSPMEFLVKGLFHRRNKILHSGQVQFGKSEAEGCVRMAMSLLQVIRQIVKERYARLDKELRGGKQLA